MKQKNIDETASKSKLKIIPLGGLEQIGMNITAFEYEDSIIVVDCGLSFPDDDMLGVDLVIPDVTYLKQNLIKHYMTKSRELWLLMLLKAQPWMPYPL